MTITVSVPDELVQQAAQQGLSVEAYVELWAQQAAYSEPQWVRLGPGPLTPEQAVDDLREARKGVTLGGLKIKDLVHEGHKY
jgi:anthranilate/para-aminobenzoate synthase component II